MGDGGVGEDCVYAGLIEAYYPPSEGRGCSYEGDFGGERVDY